MRTSILDAASRMLVENGYAGLSMRKLAGSIGYSATTIYHHFDGKDGLFHALVDEGMERLGAELRGALVGMSRDTNERMERLCRAYVRFGLDNPEYYEVMFIAHPGAAGRYPPEKYRRARANLDLFADVLTEAGAPDTTTARVEATVIWAVLHGTVSLINATRVDAAIDRIALVDAAVERAIDRGNIPSEWIPSE